MKKAMSNKALEKEALYWKAIKQAAQRNTGKVCHK